MRNLRRIALALVVVAAPTVPGLADEPSSVIQTKPNVVWVGDAGDEGVAYLGVQLREETEHPEGGALVTDVVDGSPADEAGLREGDIIVRFDGHTIRGPVGLTEKIHASKPGDRVAIRVIRDGRERELEVAMGQRSKLWRSITVPEITLPEIDLPEIVVPQLEEEFAERMRELGERLGRTFACEGDDCDDLLYFGDCEGKDCPGYRALEWWGGRPTLGVQLIETTRELREHLGGDADAGVLVSKVLEGTPAQRADLRVGDLIVSIDGEAVASARDIRRALRNKSGRSFPVEVLRDGQRETIEVTIPEPEADRPTGPRA